ncbi:MAG: flagellar basal body rod C-terminal domain-containing protein [Pseudomonadota bacterium]
MRQLNDALGRASKLNSQIQTGLGSGQDTSSLQDQRQQIIDQIAQIVPLREVAQNDGTVALYTTGGAVLLDKLPAVFGFTPTAAISAPMTQQSGGLSGLTLNGRATPTAGSGSFLLGGTLAANFALRDDLAVSAQAQIDAVARDLVERFQDSGLDATRAAGDAGLFTDAGNTFSPANEVGLAQRLALNRKVDPEQGGALWRLRDGLGATTPGPPGASALLSRLNAALTGSRQTASGAFSPGQRSFSVLTGDLVSNTAASTLSAQGEVTFATTRLATLTSLEAEGGVDSDFEMQSLLQVEQSYTANAKVLKAVGDMMQTLLDM